MPDDRTKFPRPKSNWDDARRAAAGKVHRKTPPHGYPIATIDPELTPPPVAPDLGSLPGSDTIPPAVKTQLTAIGDSLGQLTSAVGRVWDARNDSGRIDKITTQIDLLSKDVTSLTASFREFVSPAVKQLMGRASALEERAANVGATTNSFFSREWPHFVETFGQVDKHLETLATTAQLLNKEVETLKQRVTDSNTELRRQFDEHRAEAALDRVRILALETRNLQQDAGDKRQRWLFRLAIAALAPIGGAAVWLYERFVK